MFHLASTHAIRDAEQQWFDTHPGEDLMGVAAHAVAQAAAQMLTTATAARIVVAVGPGNNGGDGLFAAAELAAQGHQVQLWFTATGHHRAGAAAAFAAGATPLDAAQAVAALGDADLVIDAVYGIGARPGLPTPIAEFARAVTDLGVPVLSVDLPSGITAESNQPDAASFQATTTVTFAAAKLAHVAAPAASRCGRVTIVDIGITPSHEAIRVLEKPDVALLWPYPGPTSDKYSRGVVGIDAGSERYPGAGVLATLGALYAGAGMIRFVGAERSADVLRGVAPSVTIGHGRVQAWVAGPGWSQRSDARDRLDALIATGVPGVLDADALAVLPDWLRATTPDRLRDCLLTPHAGELARLLHVDRSLVTSDPVGAARAGARAYGATVLVKGATQYVARPDGDVLIAVAGPAWSAQAGSGDVLAGICGTLLAAGLDAQLAGALAASAQALAAASHPGPYPPNEIAARLPAVIGGLERAARVPGIG